MKLGRSQGSAELHTRPSRARGAPLEVYPRAPRSLLRRPFFAEGLGRGPFVRRVRVLMPSCLGTERCMAEGFAASEGGRPPWHLVGVQGHICFDLHTLCSQMFLIGFYLCIGVCARRIVSGQSHLERIAPRTRCP